MFVVVSHEELEGAGDESSSYERTHVTLQALAGQERGYQGHLIGYASISPRVPPSRLRLEPSIHLANATTAARVWRHPWCHITLTGWLARQATKP